MPLENAGSTNDDVIFTNFMRLLNTALTGALKSNITESGGVITYDFEKNICEPIGCALFGGVELVKNLCFYR